MRTSHVVKSTEWQDCRLVASGFSSHYGQGSNKCQGGKNKSTSVPCGFPLFLDQEYIFQNIYSNICSTSLYIGGYTALLYDNDAI